MTLRASHAVLGVGMCLLLSAPGTALGVTRETSYQGADWSNNSAAGTTLYVYDGEYDGRQVAGDYYRLRSDVMWTLVNGLGPNTTASGNTREVIVRHRAVELVPIGTDAYGPWRWPH